MKQHGYRAPDEEQPVIPDKLYFRIGEVSHIAGVEPYVLRYWESEFPFLAPKKSGSGHRLFRRKEVELILELKRLLYEKRFTIEGARLYLEQNRKSKTARAEPAKPASQGALFGVSPDAISAVRRELMEILELLR